MVGSSCVRFVLRMNTIAGKSSEKHELWNRVTAIHSFSMVLMKIRI